MNLLTDIIRDVAESFGLKLTREEEFELQKDILRDVAMRVGTMKERQVRAQEFPWLERKLEKEVV